jgi:hypothetical protein
VTDRASTVRLPSILVFAALIALVSAAILLAPLLTHGSRPSPAAPNVKDLAAIDFERVKSGLSPACQPEPDYGLSDGGTLVYECAGYQLTVKRSLATQNGVDGYLYGPIITFESGRTMSDIRFYTDQELSHLVARKDGL